LLEKVHPNLKAGHEQFALFEIGKAHDLLHKDDDDGIPSEFDVVDFVYVADDKVSSGGAPFYQAKKYLDLLAHTFGLLLDYSPIKTEPEVSVAAPYDHKRSAFVTVKGGGEFLGMIGEFKPSVRRNLKLPKYSAAFGINLRQLQESIAKNDGVSSSYAALPRFPVVTQDICLKVPTTMNYSELYNFVRQKLDEAKPKQTFARLEPVDIYQREGDEEYKQITLRLTIASYERTLTDAEVARLLDDIAEVTKTELNAARI
jgi:phenylalanyl-tRNA synthetase beta subunit